MHLVYFSVCRSGPQHLEQEMKRAEEKGCEGIMLRRPHSLYHQDRSESLLKHKIKHRGLVCISIVCAPI